MLKVAGSITDIRLDVMREHARPIMQASPVEYIKGAKLRGSVFDDSCDDGTVSSADTAFFVDHSEPLQALENIRKDSVWPLGELFDGHEFLLIIQHQPRLETRSA